MTVDVTEDSFPAVKESLTRKQELRKIAEGQGLTVMDDMSTVQIMDALREATGSFDPSKELDPAKAQDLKKYIDWTNAGHEFDSPEFQKYLSDDWVLEPKLDGMRYRVYLGATSNTLNSGQRSKTTYKYMDRSDNMPHLRDTVVEELAGTIIDVELLPPVDSIDLGGGDMTQGTLATVLSMVNTNEKQSLSRQKKYGKVVVMAFDVLAVKGEDVTGLPQEDRRKMLEMIMPVLQAREPAFQLVPQFEATEENIRLSLAQGLEGVMLKKKNGKYRPGKRMSEWQKVKRMSTGDFYIIGAVPGNGSNAGLVGSMKVGYRGENGEDVYVADVAGIDQATRVMISDTNNPGQIKPEYLGKVIEVMGQGRTKNNRIRHPHFVRWRGDKTAEETDSTQLDLFSPV